MDRLAARDPDPARRLKRDGLLVSRALMRPSQAGGELLWQARGSDGAAGFFLGGAVLTERFDRPEAARCWLALDLLARARPEAARALLDGTNEFDGLYKVRPQDATTWERGPVGKRLQESLAQK